MIEPGVAIVERDTAIESLMDLDFGSGEAEAAGLGMNLQPAAAPLHNVIVADDAFMGEATDAFEILRSRALGVRCVAGSASEAAVVVRDEASQDAVGRIQIASLGHAEFAGEAILKHAPKAFDAAFGLGALRGDEGEQPSQGFAAQREAFFFDELLLEMMIVEAGVARARQF